jgi:hypothetical protein
MPTRFEEESLVLNGHESRWGMLFAERRRHAIVGRHDVLPIHLRSNDSAIGSGARVS